MKTIDNSTPFRLTLFLVGCLSTFSTHALAMDSNVFRFDAREGFGRSVATGTEIVGEPDGASITAWDSTKEADGWTALQRGGESASVCVLNGPAVEGGRLATNEVWGADRIHVVRDDAVVPDGVTLTLEADAVVKFTVGARIRVEDGGAILAKGALLADVADDSVGGDVNFDGSSTTRGTVDWWREDAAVGALAHVALVDGSSEGFPTRSYTVGEAFGNLPAPERRGSIFGGWFTEPDGAGTAALADVPVAAGTEAVYAKWTPMFVSIEPVATNVTGVASNYAFSVTANATWTVSTGADWITIQTGAGDGDGTVSFAVADNENTSSRSATIRVSLDEADGFREFTVEQEGMEPVAAPTIRPVDGTTFTGNLRRIALSCDTPDAVLYYTLDGSEPTKASYRYTSSFNIFDTTTIRVRAYVYGMIPSPVATARIIRLRTLAEAIDQPLWIVETGVEHPWTVVSDVTHDGAFAARSAAISDGESTTISAAVDGSGTLSFWWKVSSEDDPSEYDNWDYLAFRLDGVDVAHVDGDSGWNKFTVQIREPGPHTLEWAYVKDDFDENPLEDSAWLDQVSWEPTVSEYDIPVSWMENMGLVRAGEDPEAAANADPDGDGYTNAEEYIAGTDPNDPDSHLLAEISIVDGQPVVTPNPELTDRGTKSVREYRRLGKKTLDPNEEWQDVTDVTDLDEAGYRFFKVKVVQPEE